MTSKSQISALMEAYPPGKQSAWGRALAGHPGDGGAPFEQRVEWRPSRDDLRAHPEIPAEAVVRGRLIVAHIEGEDGKRWKLCLFTTLEEPREVLVELYRRRWNIELDIRSLKQTLRMHSLSAKTPDMAEKELLLATAAYNLVRSVQMAAARQA